MQSANVLQTGWCPSILLHAVGLLKMDGPPEGPWQIVIYANLAPHMWNVHRALGEQLSLLSTSFLRRLIIQRWPAELTEVVHKLLTSQQDPQFIVHVTEKVNHF